MGSPHSVAGRHGGCWQQGAPLERFMAPAPWRCSVTMQTTTPRLLGVNLDMGFYYEGIQYKSSSFWVPTRCGGSHDCSATNVICIS